MRAIAPLLAFLLREKSLRQNLGAFAKFLVVIAGTVLLFSVGFRTIMLVVENREYSWVTGCYWTLTVMSTLGFGDITFHSGPRPRCSAILASSGGIFMMLDCPAVRVHRFLLRTVDRSAAQAARTAGRPRRCESRFTS